MKSKLLDKILDKATDAKLSYCFIRNFKEDLSSTPDVDILVDFKSYPKFKTILQDLDFKQIFAGPVPGHAVFIKDDPDLQRFINLDLHIGGLIRDGVLYFEGEKMLNSRKKLRNYFIPSDECYIIGIILHCIIDKKKFKKKYKDEIIRIRNQKSFNEKEFRDLINYHFPSNSNQIIMYFKANKLDNLLKLRKKIIYERYWLYPKGLLNTSFIYIKRLFKLLNPVWKGALIVCIGPEGGGKSTVSSIIQDSLQKSAIRSHRIYMGWHEIIIPFYSTLKKTDKKLFKETNMKNSRKKLIRTYLIFFIYYLELLLRYWLKIYPKRKLGIAVVTDRYFYDSFMYEDIPFNLKRLMLHLVPKPSITFYFKADIKTLINRKPEVGDLILKKQLRIYDQNYKVFKSKKFYNDEKLSSMIRKINHDIYKYI